MMNQSTNNQLSSFLAKFGIEELNEMQKTAYKKISSGKDVVVLSPTGTGKTLAFLLPLMEKLDKECQEIQLLILVPTRELAQQIEQVARKIGSGFKINSVYGGRAGALDKRDLEHRPAVLIGTPGRVADRLRRDNLSVKDLKTIVLDEYDKSLEIGFEKEMTEIMNGLPYINQRILTSATSEVEILKFIQLNEPITINFITRQLPLLTFKIVSTSDNKIDGLKKTLRFIGAKSGIIFCNFKDSLDSISEELNKDGFKHECFHGGMEQLDREKALIKFRNGTSHLLLATDLAARGIDISALDFIIHYHLPVHEKEFTHRNGRTARMNKEGTAFILHKEKENLPDFIQSLNAEKLHVEDLLPSKEKSTASWETLFISGGRRDKISKGDIAGLFYKEGNIKKEELGNIEIQQTVSFVAVNTDKADKLIAQLNNSKLKKKKVRISKA